MQNTYQLLLKKYNNNHFLFFLPKRLVEVYKPLPDNQRSTLNLQLQSTVIISKSDRDWLNLYDDNTRTKRKLNENVFKEIEDFEDKIEEEMAATSSSNANAN